jgi:hypothetical protein
MQPPTSKTFHDSPLTKELVSTLKRINKTLDDVEYVGYAVAQPNFGHIDHYYCDIGEFLAATTYATSCQDIHWPHEIHVVGKEFWLDYDYHGLWILHAPPTKPMTYRCPSKRDLLREGL